MSRRGAVEAKPAWLRLLCPPDTAGMEASVCHGCGRWTVLAKDGVWDRLDPGVISGDDIAVAIILDRRLMRIQRIPGLTRIRLVAVCGTYGLRADGEYLGEHRCWLAPVSRNPYKPRKPSRKETTMRWPKTRPAPDCDDPWAALLAEEMQPCLA